MKLASMPASFPSFVRFESVQNSLLCRPLHGPVKKTGTRGRFSGGSEIHGNPFCVNMKKCAMLIERFLFMKKITVRFFSFTVYDTIIQQYKESINITNTTFCLYNAQ